MLRIILLVVILISSTNVFANTFFVKYNDFMKSSTVTEEFKNKEDLSNRLEELNYINGQSIKILNSGNKNVSSRSNGQTVDAIKRGGEGGGE